jgi:DNA polymerase-3 subunit alpha
MRQGERGVAGVLDLNGPKSVRVDTELLDALRAHPGVRTVKVNFTRPWTN